MATTTEVPGRFDVAIDGRPYRIDANPERYTWRLQGPMSVPVNRVQTDTSGKAGEQSLSREDLWRRTITSWHHGAGQVNYDDETGDPYRFNKSLGVDVWTPGQMVALGGLARRPVPAANAGHIASTFPNQMLLFNGNPYVSGSATCATGYDLWGAATACTVPNGILSWCTDGATVYIADAGGGGTGGGLYTSPMAGAAATLYVAAGTYYLTRWALGRLWAADSTTLANITSGATRTTAYTNTTATWKWTDVVPGNGGVLASGYDKTHSVVVFVGLLPDGSAIDTGYVVAEMPAGETIFAMHSFLGYTLLGTNKGVRICKHDGGSGFTIGPLIDTFSATANNGFKAPSSTGVRCFASFDRFVYFGWSFYDWGGQTNATETSGNFMSGLGRIDMSQFNAALQPAYATDVMSFVQNTDLHTSGEVTGCVVDKWGIPAFVVHGDELYAGSRAGTPTKTTYATDICAGVYMRTGNITMGIDDVKTWNRFRANFSPLTVPTQTFLWYFTDRSTQYNPIISLATGQTSGLTNLYSTSEIATPPPPGQSLEFTLLWTDTSGLLSPIKVYDMRLEAWPSPSRLERWQVPLLLSKTVECLDGTTHTYDSLQAEVDAIKALGSEATRAVVDFQFRGQNYKAVVDDWEFFPNYQDADLIGTEYQGLLVVTLTRQVT